MPRVTHRALLVVVGVLAVAAIIGIAAQWPGSRAASPVSGAPPAPLLDATLLAVERLPTGTEQLVPGAVEVLLTARLQDSGEVVVFSMQDDSGDTFRPGQAVRLETYEAEGATTGYFVNDFRRARPLLLLAVLFCVAVLAFGRLQGLRALLGLGLTALLVVGFLIPAILDGRDPVLAALAAAIAVMLVTLYLAHGASPKTTAAAVGTALALLLTAGLSAVFLRAAAITGFASEEAQMLNLQLGGVNLRGLLLAGIILGGLGVLDDVTVAQSSTVFELARADRTAGFAALLRGALVVGRDHVAATVNTLFLAYAGAALPLLILFSTGIDPVGTVVTSEVVAVEVIRTLVGSLGLIAAVPLTTALAAALAVGEPAAVNDLAGSLSLPPEREELEEPEEPWIDQLRESYGLEDRTAEGEAARRGAPPPPEGS